MLGWDDYTILATALLALARLGCQVGQVFHGNGRHRWYIEPEEYVISNMYGWYAQLLLFLAVCLLKISICLLLLRIKDTRKLRNLIYAVMGGLVLTNGGVIIILLSECRPIEAYSGGDGECWDSRVRIYSIYFAIGASSRLHKPPGRSRRRACTADKQTRDAAATRRQIAPGRANFGSRSDCTSAITGLRAERADQRHDNGGEAVHAGNRHVRPPDRPPQPGQAD